MDFWDIVSSGLSAFGLFKQKKHDEEREDNAYQRTVQDMLKAGLNPSTLTGGTDTTTPSTITQDLEAVRTNRVTENLEEDKLDIERDTQHTDATLRLAEIQQKIAEFEELKNTNKWNQQNQRELNKLKAQENALKQLSIESENATRRQQRLKEIRDRDEQFFMHGLSIGGESSSFGINGSVTSIPGTGVGLGVSGSGVSGITGGIQDFIPPSESKKGYNKLRNTRKDLPEDYSFSDNYIGTKQSVNGHIICGFTDPNGRIMYFSYDGNSVKTSDMSQKEWNNLNDLYSSGVQ